MGFPSWEGEAGEPRKGGVAKQRRAQPHRRGRCEGGRPRQREQRQPDIKIRTGRAGDLRCGGFLPAGCELELREEARRFDRPADVGAPVAWLLTSQHLSLLTQNSICLLLIYFELNIVHVHMRHDSETDRGL